MSTTIYTDIRAALEQRLAAMPGLPAVTMENVGYVPVKGMPFLAPTILWAESSQAEIGTAGRNWETGIFQITGNYPSNQGPGPAATMAGLIREWFKRGTELNYNGVTVKIKKVYLGPVSVTTVGISQPLSIVFFSQAAN